jgi:hypothetical protein
MRDSGAMVAERRVQPRFSFPELLQIVALIAAFVVAWRYLGHRPNRHADGPAITQIDFRQAKLQPSDVLPLRLVGAWEVVSPDHRFGGFSALVIDRGDLLAVTDRGFVWRFGKPSVATQVASIIDLPGGPFSNRFTWNRDAEALARDPLGRGWWIAFEKHHELWLYDHGFSRGLKRVQLGRGRWPTNLGVEGLIARHGPELLIFTEANRRFFRMRGGQGRAGAITGLKWKISEAAKLPDGSILAIERGFGPTGFRNRLIELEPDGAGYRVGARVPLNVGPLDNIEGMAVETRPAGAVRLWLISDDNYQRPLRTLLLAVDLPPKRKVD